MGDGGNHGVGGHDELRALDGNGPSSTGFIGLSQLHPHAPYPAYMTIGFQHLNRGRQDLKLNPLLLRLINLPGACRHFSPGPTIEDLYLLRSQSECRPGGIGCRVAAPNDHGLLPDLGGDGYAEGNDELIFKALHNACPLRQAHPLEEGDAVVNPSHILAGDPQLLRFMSPYGEKDAPITRLQESIDITDGGVQFELNPQFEDIVDLPLQHLSG